MPVLSAQTPASWAFTAKSLCLNCPARKEPPQRIAYVTVAGPIKKIDDYEDALSLAGGARILIENILSIEPTAP